MHRVPMAAGPRETGGMWLHAVDGRHAAWVLNVEANPAVRIRASGRWRSGTATVHCFDPHRAAQFNLYGRAGPRLDAVVVRVDWTDE
jgi:hypothetical protein